MKKFLLLFMAVLTLGVTARAADDKLFKDGDWLFLTNPYADNEVSVVQYEGAEGCNAVELTIPSYASDGDSRYFVTALYDYLFTEANIVDDDMNTLWSHDAFRKLEKVTIPNTVTEIGAWAFEGCTGLTSITIPNSVTKIGESTFEGCTGLTSITIPNSVTKIGMSAFFGCTGLTSITIPNSVTEIEGSAFRYCSGLTSVTIPNSVTEIDGYAFLGCSGLQEFVVEDGNSKYTAVDGVLYNSERTILTIYPGGKEGAFEIPNTVTEIGARAFYGCTGLTSVTIPNSVTKIEEEAFRDCTGLTSVSIPNSVTEIENAVFYGCTGLTSVTIPNSVTEIGTHVFWGCTGLTSVTIPNTVTEISASAFRNCSGLTLVTIPNTVTEIGGYAFSGCTSLNTIYALPATPPTCGNYAFSEVPKAAVVYIPKGSFKAYFVADGWTRFTDFREMGALDVTLSESTISIEEGKTATIIATVTHDDDVTVASETWSSSNPEVATVDGGVVTAVAEGTATITYTVVDGYGCPHTESCEVTVSANTAIDDITVNGSNAPVEYFNFNGVRVNADNLTPGLYIKRQGGKATKVLVK